MSLTVLGVILACGLLVIVGYALVMVLRAPFRALGVLVAGMAVHNIGVMALLRLDTPGFLVRLVQSWKEAILLLLAVLAGRMAWQAWQARRFPRLVATDYLALAFAALACIYLLLPQSLLGGDGSLEQKLVSFRITLLMPALYAFGRIFWRARREDLVWVARTILASAGLVGLFGLVELWFVPTHVWVDAGANLFSAWLGYDYPGPGGLPENFFHSTGSGFGLRRMVSTYISPLGLAYTGLLVLPLAACVVSLKRNERELPQWFRWAAFALLITGILFSVTRGALLSMIAELALLAILLRKWRLAAATVAATACVAFVLLEYVLIGPLVTFKLEDVRPPAGYVAVRYVTDAFGSDGARYTSPPVSAGGGGTSSGELLERTLSAEDPSARGHVAALNYGAQYAWKYPFGTGLGSAVLRYGGDTGGLHESALLTIFGEMGILGGLLYLALYALSILHAFRAFWRTRGDLLLACYPLVPLVGGLGLAPIMLTSGIWGNFSVTFLFWWCAGLSASLLTQFPSEASPPAALDTLSPQEAARPI